MSCGLLSLGTCFCTPAVRGVCVRSFAVVVFAGDFVELDSKLKKVWL